MSFESLAANDESVDSATGALMFKWEKLGKIFDPRDHKNDSWMQEFAQSPSVQIYEKHLRVYFCSRPAPTPDGQYLSFLSYIDVDRKNLLRILNICSAPILSLGALGTFDEFGTAGVFVIRDQDDVRVYYVGFTRCESVPFNVAIGLAISHDVHAFALAVLVAVAVQWH